MKTTKPETDSKLKEYSKHPIFIMLMGAVLTYFLVPIYTDYKSRSDQEKELIKDLSSFNSQVLSKLNVLKTHLNLCTKDAKYSGADFYGQRSEMGHQANQLYLEYDALVWAGFNDLKFRFKNVDRLEKDTVLRDLFKDYHTNLCISGGCLDELWDNTLRTNKKMDFKTIAIIEDSTNARFRRLVDDRYRIIRDITARIEESQ